MSKTMRWLSLTLVFGATVTLFNNCGTFDDASTFSSSASSVSCEDADCVSQTVNNLSIKPNLAGTTEFSVPVGLADFDIGGDCNEGGYITQNVIRWELYLNNIKVRDSNMVGSGGPGLASNTSCSNGRFRIYVNLGSITQDAVNRTGLSTGATRSPYDLWIEVYGVDPISGAPQRNTIKGRTRVSLIPVATL